MPAGQATIVVCLILAVLIGLEEVSQMWVPARTFSLLDLSASYLGVAFFAWLAGRVKHKTARVEGGSDEHSTS